MPATAAEWAQFLSAQMTTADQPSALSLSVQHLTAREQVKELRWRGTL